MARGISLEARLRKLSSQATIQRLKIAVNVEDEAAWVEIRDFLRTITRNLLDPRKTLGKQSSKLDLLKKKIVDEKSHIFGRDQAQSEIRLECAMMYIEKGVFPYLRSMHRKNATPCTEIIRPIPPPPQVAQAPDAATASASDFINRFLSSCLPPLTHLLPALVHAQLTEARIRGMGVRWAAADIEEFLRSKLGRLRDANGALVDDIDLAFLARHCVYYFGVGSGSRGGEI